MTTSQTEKFNAHGGVRIYIRAPQEVYEDLRTDLYNLLAQFFMEWGLDNATTDDVLFIEVVDGEDIRAWAEGELPEVQEAKGYCEPLYVSFKSQEDGSE